MEPLAQWIVDKLAIPELFQPYVFAAIIGAGAGAIVTFAAIYAGIFIFFERRIGARMMSRIGPNRVGPQGVLQWLADAVKLIIKEDIIPDSADKPLFKLAPYLMAMGVFGGFAVLPFSYRVIGADLNIGLLYAFILLVFKSNFLKIYVYNIFALNSVITLIFLYKVNTKIILLFSN